MKNSRSRGLFRILGYGLFAVGLILLGIIYILLRFSVVTDYMYHGLVKDPERTAPAGQVIVAPADGTVLYIKKVSNGIIPEVVKKGVAVPVVDHLKAEPKQPFKEGYLIGIYMNTFGVHINRIPNKGVVKESLIFNGPHMDMSQAEREIILAQLIPGKITLRKAFGMPPFNLEDSSDYILKSARETLVIEEDRGTTMYIVRIADYFVGKILTWVKAGEPVKRGQKMGMICWGSQTDLFVESSPGLTIKTKTGDYVYAGETVLADF